MKYDQYEVDAEYCVLKHGKPSSPVRLQGTTVKIESLPLPVTNLNGWLTMTKVEL